jgi:hypothetical protein
MLIHQALEEYGARNFAEARALFLQAHATYPTARTLRGLGMAEFELRNYTDSAQNLAAALESARKPLTGELRLQTEALLSRARSFIAYIDVQTSPPALADAQGLRLQVDGEPVEWKPGRPIVTGIGEHVLVLHVPGFEEERRTFSVKGAEQTELRFQLRPQELATAREPDTQSEKVADKRPLRKNPWLWSGAIVAAAAIAGGVVMGVLLSRDHAGTSEAIPGDVGGVVQTSRAP